VAWWWLSPQQISHENGPIENLQILVLLLTCVLSCIAARKPGERRTAAVALAGSSLLLLVRELDLRPYMPPEWIASASTGAKILMWLVFAATLAYILSRYRHILDFIRSGRILKAWVFFLWIPLLILGQLIEEWTDVTHDDDRYDYWASGQFWEEMTELNAYLIFLIAAYTLYRVNRCPSADGAGASAIHRASRPRS